MTFKRSGRTILVAAAVIAALAVSAMAAVYWLSPSQAARDLFDEPGVAEAFAANGETDIQTAKVGGYEVAFEGIVSGENLTKHAMQLNGEVVNGRSYVVFAVSGGNVAELNEMNDATLTSLGLSLTPLVKGHAPWELNAWTLGGGYAAVGRGDTVYFLFETSSLEQYAPEDIYYAAFACEGMGVPSNAEFSMAEDGTIMMNDGVDGVMFTVNN